MAGARLLPFRALLGLVGRGGRLCDAEALRARFALLGDLLGRGGGLRDRDGRLAAAGGLCSSADRLAALRARLWRRRGCARLWRRRGCREGDGLRRGASCRPRRSLCQANRLRHAQRKVAGLPLSSVPSRRAPQRAPRACAAPGRPWSPPQAPALRARARRREWRHWQPRLARRRPRLPPPAAPPARASGRWCPDRAAPAHPAAPASVSGRSARAA